MKIYRRSGYEKHDPVPRGLVFIAYVLEGLSCKSEWLWDRGPINGRTTNSFCDTEDLVHFYLKFFYSNTFKLQFDREDTQLQFDREDKHFISLSLSPFSKS